MIAAHARRARVRALRFAVAIGLGVDGDSISVECTYLNTTDRVVMWGDSSLAEMCIAGVGVYPSTNSGGFPCSG